MIVMNGIPLTTDEDMKKLSSVVNWAFDIAFAGQDDKGLPHCVVVEFETLQDGRKRLNNLLQVLGR